PSASRPMGTTSITLTFSNRKSSCWRGMTSPKRPNSAAVSVVPVRSSTFHEAFPMFQRFQNPKSLISLACLLAFGTTAGGAAAPAAGEETKAADAASPLVVVVMDPLALPLSCPCVKGYAQRDYQKLAEALEAQLGRSVSLVFN